MKHYIIPVFIPHYGCRHRCIFCNQKKITGGVVTTEISGEDVEQIINEHILRIDRPRHIELAFYGGSFTALPLEYQRQLLNPAFKALQKGRIHTIRLSTRPDAIDRSIVEQLCAFGVSIVELGAQSLEDSILQKAARGHTYQDIEKAVALLDAADLQCGLQLMLGLPGEDWRSLTRTAGRLLRLQPAMVRIYPTLVIADTHLAVLYQRKQYIPLTLAEAIKRAAFVKLICEQNQIPVIRVGLQASEELSSRDTVLSGPYHPAFGEMVDSYLFQLMFQKFAVGNELTNKQIVICHHPKDHSKVRGNRNHNLMQWKSEYACQEISLFPDGEKTGELFIQYEGLSYCINKSMLYCI
ncbi:hypothetical protein P22_1689 [Propionispora sp. 2/2-37]|uniref:elongator complex protein 3 n=1 Tax=Propionispora sp. 2/2-37 TaxID=1677858 RepID=UPI0006BB99D6|nr:radical SAM protein [Propionispora sp. 2/2-37]CUH95615.1 hypothetical protein P22_1689 [Propionispora sp. 2/2-37]